jgi:hypothetical protein
MECLATLWCVCVCCRSASCSALHTASLDSFTPPHMCGRVVCSGGECKHTFWKGSRIPESLVCELATSHIFNRQREAGAAKNTCCVRCPYCVIGWVFFFVRRPWPLMRFRSDRTSPCLWISSTAMAHDVGRQIPHPITWHGDLEG